MSGIEARVAEVLRGHFWWFVGNLGVPGMPDQKGYKCSCGWETHGDATGPPDSPHGHVAAVLVAELGLREEEGADFTGGGLVRYVTEWQEQVVRPRSPGTTPAEHPDGDYSRAA